MKEKCYSCILAYFVVGGWKIKVQVLYLRYNHYLKVLGCFNLSSRVCFSLLFMLERLNLSACTSYHRHKRRMPSSLALDAGSKWRWILVGGRQACDT